MTSGIRRPRRRTATMMTSVVLVLFLLVAVAVVACSGSRFTVATRATASKRVPKGAVPSNVQCDGRAGKGTVAVESASSSSLLVSWDTPAAGEFDAFYVAVGEPNTLSGRPYYAVPTTNTSVVVLDLMPATTYELTLYYHRAALPSFVWGWEALNETITCATASTHQAEAQLKRTTGPHPSSFKISLSMPPFARANVTTAAASQSVEIRTLSLGDAVNWSHHTFFRVSATCVGQPVAACWELQSGAPAKDSASATHACVSPKHLHHTEATCEATITQLNPSTAYMVVAVSHGPPSPTVIAVDVMFTQASKQTRFDELFRISEYTLDLDFLENHNSATPDALAAYLSHGTPLNTSTFWPNSTAHDWDMCQSTLSRVCGHVRGRAFDCMACATNYHDDIARVCGGNFTSRDDPFEGFAVHFFCGIGWPESLVMNSTIAQYCVESQPVPGGGFDRGYAQYLSCNSDETDYLGNKPIDPTCICWVYDDRVISQQNASELHRHCDFNHREPYVNETTCNCGPNGQLILPDNPSARYVGISPVLLPYGFWLDKAPPSSYPVSVNCGDNFSTPRMGSCGLTQSLGENGCTWRMLPRVRMLFGPDLMHAGWNPNPPADTLTNMTATEANVRAFQRAVATVETRLKPRCCGC
ncbi:hypothetical protein PTSG_07846 [Salpingoeca rosetta]|uniref:Fibronectin type-III domain-containing protein n=1 Tax=Salpingoeca rosetta (strain ATCC 50818 / BSB-021) TaxID=946362 RepID=F2UGI0_SALR5|nr:uncharacterized protein PTSG_07846 [Salpingoeca rosetta]EGD75730.1 hypothetical protein PTSG_07846 [Salpingoeca rosetta]|eukprot:XP_004991651.1 hypothetical protein PTSG_07846 [Salpingoeca rosetta]